MDYRASILRSRALSNIPERKLQEKILSLVHSCKICSLKNVKVIEQAIDGLCERCAIHVIAYNRYANSNLSVEYWDFDMKDFKGAPPLKKVYDDISESLQQVYQEGTSICLAGPHGIGKSLVSSCIIKKACQKNYVCLYTTLSDMVSALIDSFGDEKYMARKELMTVDFLVIDELDPRFVGNGNGADLFGKMLEHIFRTRIQNKMPTFICTNSPNPLETFSGSIKQSLDSIMSKVKFIPLMEEDFRKPIMKNIKNLNDNMKEIKNILEKLVERELNLWVNNGAKIDDIEISKYYGHSYRDFKTTQDSALMAQNWNKKGMRNLKIANECSVQVYITNSIVVRLIELLEKEGKDLTSVK